jgi:hypothetical protein
MRANPTTHPAALPCTCAQCGRVFHLWPSELKQGKGAFCSRRCRGIASRKPRARVVRPSAAERFWAMVDKNGPVPAHMPHLGPCWLWTGGHTSAGYGNFRLSAEDGNDQAHRVMYLLERGVIPDGLWVLHHCDNRPCVNPDHLFLGTRQDNSDDMVAKGRSVRGERNPRHRLTAAIVLRLRQRHQAGGASWTQWAAEYGVTATTIQQAVLGRTWKHLGSASTPTPD